MRNLEKAQLRQDKETSEGLRVLPDRNITSYESHRCTVHFIKSLQLLTNKCTYITTQHTTHT